MSITASIYSNANARSQSVTVTFEGEILAPSYGVITSDVDYFFKVKTNTRDINNVTIPPKLMLGLDSLPLGTKQSATNTANSYSNIKEMIVDHMYDLIYGHTANQWSSGCKEQKPMKFN